MRPPTMRKTFDFYSRSNQLLLDGCCFAISFPAAYPIRLEAWPAGADLRQLIIWLPILVATRPFVHWTRGIYRQVWKFVSFSDAIEIAKSILIVTGVLALLRFGFPGKNSLSALVKIPASIIAIEGLFSLPFRWAFAHCGESSTCISVASPRRSVAKFLSSVRCYMARVEPAS